MLDATVTTDTTVAAAPVLTKHQTEERRRMLAWFDERVAASKKRPLAEIVTITPILAGILLEHNLINRPIGRYNLDNLRADVSSKRWEFNGESIIVSRSGNLLDGQHRCQTVLDTGVSIEAVIVFGPIDDARFTIDVGTSKTAGNYLAMKGMSNSNHLAAAIAMVLQYKSTGHIHATSSVGRSKGIGRPTKVQIVEAVDDLRGIDKSIEFVVAGKKKKLGSISCLAFCHYTLWKRASRELADEFLQGIIDGEGYRRGSPIYYCRDRLISLEGTTRASTRAELIFRCWNAWRRGETITKIPLNGSLPKLEK